MMVPTLCKKFQLHIDSVEKKIMKKPNMGFARLSEGIYHDEPLFCEPCTVAYLGLKKTEFAQFDRQTPNTISLITFSRS